MNDDFEEWTLGSTQEVSPVEESERFVCRHCRLEWFGPAESHQLDRREIAERCRAGKLVDTLKIPKVGGYAFRDAKWTVLHISKTQGVCHRCGKQIPIRTSSVVCRCGSIALNW